MTELLAPSPRLLNNHTLSDARLARHRDRDSPGTTSAREAATTVRLRPSSAAPSLARNHVRWICTNRDLPDAVVRDIAFIAGELVAISVRQVHAPLDLVICIGQTNATIQVHDLGAGKNARSRPNGVGTNRSLRLVQGVAQSLRVSITEDRREVWATVAFRARSECDDPIRRADS